MCSGVLCVYVITYYSTRTPLVGSYQRLDLLKEQIVIVFLIVFYLYNLKRVLSSLIMIFLQVQLKLYQTSYSDNLAILHRLEGLPKG